MGRIMRGWTSIFVGFLLLAVAVWVFTAEGLGASTLICGVAAGFFFFRGAQGLTVGESGDPTALIDFVANPADAIVDSATDRFAEWLGDGSPKDAPEQPKFDVEAAFARYMEHRPADAPAVPSMAPQRGFGRKGL
jgi:hypothetical protein